MRKITPPNGSFEGIGVADQCRHLLTFFALCPRLAPAASFAGFYNCIVLLYVSLRQIHGGTTLLKAKFGIIPQFRTPFQTHHYFHRFWFLYMFVGEQRVGGRGVMDFLKKGVEAAKKAGSKAVNQLKEV